MNNLYRQFLLLLILTTSQVKSWFLLSRNYDLPLPIARRRIKYNSPTIRPKTKVSSSWYDDDDDDDDRDDDDDDNDDEDTTTTEKDWLEAELFLRNAPSESHPDLDAETVARTVVRSLQWVDYPTELAGLKRIFEFLSFDCRKAVTARQGAETVKRFLEYGLLSPALQPFMGASIVDLKIEHATYTPAQPPIRGAMTSFPVTITSADVLAVQYQSGIPRAGIAARAPILNMIIRLEQQRRPPFQGCWLVKEIVNVEYAFAGDMGNVVSG